MWLRLLITILQTCSTVCHDTAQPWQHRTESGCFILLPILFCITCKEYLSFSAWFHSFSGHHPPEFCFKQEIATSGQPAGLERPWDVEHHQHCHITEIWTLLESQKRTWETPGSQKMSQIWTAFGHSCAEDTREGSSSSHARFPGISQIPRLNLLALIPPATPGHD